MPPAIEIGVDEAEDDVGVGDGRPRAAGARSRPARGRRRRCADRRGSSRAGRRRRCCRRPPRPRRCRAPAASARSRGPSTSGSTARSRSRPRTRWSATGAPPSMTLALAVVPPMSRQMRSRTPGCLAQPDAGDDPAGRPGLDDLGRLPGRPRGRHQAAARLHHLEPVDPGDPAQVRRELEQVARHDRADVGVDDGRARPLVLADDRQQVDRQRGVADSSPRAAGRSAARGRDCGTSGAGRPRRPRCPSARRKSIVRRDLGLVERDQHVVRRARCARRPRPASGARRAAAAARSGRRRARASAPAGARGRRGSRPS